ncbi:hypothetical protein JCM10908_005329 [Rhodotorula pacifica]|uniref:uncharacterized protein n=1 Tax=Rhodotorula pacifica TaxID=1495444 RepID=UPI00317396A1
MQCAACARSEPQRNGAWYCQNCISSRLKEYNVKRQQLRNALTLVTANATALLTGSRNRLGVEQERLLKAEKWTLASRAYAAREQVTKTKAQNQAEADQLEERRQELASRRANLATARSLLSNLETSVPSASSLSLPHSIPALQARCASLELALDTLALETARTRAILARELVAVYALRRIIIEQPLPDPFLTAPLAESTLATGATTTTSPFFDPSSTVATLRARPLPPPIAPTYTLASLPLPRLSHLLSSSPSTAHTEALLSHLVHLVRLLALYEGVALPFVPLPSCFGPGRAGVRVAIGWGDARGSSSAATSAADPKAASDSNPSSERSTPTKTSRAPVPQPTLVISEGDCFPLCYSSRSKRRRRQHDARHPSDEDGNNAGEMTATTDEGSDAAAAAAARGASVFGPRQRQRKGEGAQNTRGKAASKRTRGVLLGAVAIAYDLAYIAWMREQRGGSRLPQQQQQSTGAGSSQTAGAPTSTDWQDADLLDDLGGLLMRAAGVALDSSVRPEARPPNTNAGRHDPDNTALSSQNAVFPLSFPAAAAHFLALAFPQRQTAAARTPHASIGSDSLGESGVVVGLVNEEEMLEEDDDDEFFVDGEEDEWDLVSV